MRNQGEPQLHQPYGAMYRTGFGAPEFAQRCELIEAPATIDKGFRLRDELQLFGNILRAAGRRRGLIISSSLGYLRVELLSIILIGVLFGKRRPRLVLYGEMYQPDDGLQGRIQSLVMKLVDCWTDSFVVYSEDEADAFAATWGIARAKVRCCGYYHRPTPFPEDTAPGEYLFTGGNSFRDYAPLIEAMHQLPEQRLLLAARQLGEVGPLPEHVEVRWPSVAEWMEAIAGARAVVVPIEKDVRRAAGRLLITEAMWLNKVVIASESLGVRDLVTDGVNGLVVDGSVESYVRAIRWVCDPANADEAALMARRAGQTMAEQFSLEAHTRRLLAAMDELTGSAYAPA